MIFIREMRSFFTTYQIKKKKKRKKGRKERKKERKDGSEEKKRKKEDRRGEWTVLEKFHGVITRLPRHIQRRKNNGRFLRRLPTLPPLEMKNPGYATLAQEMRP